jgi:hypothetical protein
MPTQVPIAFPVVSFGFSGLIKRAHQAVWPVFEDDMWKPSERLMETIRHYASFPATGVSLRQMVQFGDRPSTGMCINLGSLEEVQLAAARADLVVRRLEQGLSFVPHNFSPKSYLFA